MSLPAITGPVIASLTGWWSIHPRSQGGIHSHSRYGRLFSRSPESMSLEVRMSVGMQNWWWILIYSCGTIVVWNCWCIPWRRRGRRGYAYIEDVLEVGRSLRSRWAIWKGERISGREEGLSSWGRSLFSITPHGCRSLHGLRGGEEVFIAVFTAIGIGDGNGKEMGRGIHSIFTGWGIEMGWQGDARIHSKLDPLHWLRRCRLSLHYPPNSITMNQWKQKLDVLQWRR